MKAFFPTRKTSRKSHSWPVMACRNQPAAATRQPRFRRRSRSFHFVSPKAPGGVRPARHRSSRVSCPSQPDRLAFTFVTRSTVCQRWPSVSHGIAASSPTTFNGASSLAIAAAAELPTDRRRSSVPRIRPGSKDRFQCDGRMRDDGGIAFSSEPRFLPACLRRRCVSPVGPASGPRSITQSAVLITSRLCSTTMTVLPRSTETVPALQAAGGACRRKAAGQWSVRRGDTACGPCWGGPILTASFTPLRSFPPDKVGAA